MRNFKTGVTVGGDARGAVAATNLTQKGLEDTGKKAKKTGGILSSYSKRASKAFSDAAKKARLYEKIAVAAVTATAGAMVRSGLSQVDTLAKTSDKLGIATEELAKLRFAAEQTGNSQKTLDIGLQRFTRRVADAAAGTGPAVAALDALGIKAEDLIDKSPDEALRIVADRMRLVENQTQKVSIAFKLFDSEGVGLINTLEGGSEGLDQLGRDAEAAGLAISRVDAAKVEAANDAMNRARANVTGFSQQLAVQFAPLLNDIGDRIFGIGVESGGMAKTAGRAFNFTLQAAGALADGIAVVGAGWAGMKLIFQESYRFVVGGLDKLLRFSIEMYNKLPWTDQVQVETMFSGFLATLDAEIASSRQRLDDFLNEPLPSASIKEYTEEVQQRFTASAESAVLNLQDIQGEVITTETVTNSLATSTGKAGKDVETAWDKALTNVAERIDESFVGAWKGAFDSFSDFASGIKDALQDLLAELAHQLVTRPLIMNFGAALGLGGATAGGAGIGGSSLLASGGGVGGIISALGMASSSSLFGAQSAIMQALPASMRGGAASIFGSMNGNIQGAGELFGGGFGTGMFASALGGLGGGFLANSVFGPTSGIGSTLGGLAGTLIPIPVLGPAIGSFLGGGLESLLGGKPSDKTGTALLNLSTGGYSIGGLEGKKFSQENRDAAGQFAQQFAAFAQVLGGSTGSLDIGVGNRDGLRLDGVDYGQNIDAFLKAGFQKIIDGANSLDPALKGLIDNFQGTGDELMAFSSAMVGISDLVGGNVVRDLRSALEEASGSTLVDAYNSQLTAISSMVREFDGSAAAAQELNAALAQNQQAAVGLALQYQQVTQEISGASASSAKQIRESVMSDDALRRARIAERNELRDSLSTLSDPQAIRQAYAEASRLNLELFNAIDDPTERQAEAFAAYEERLEARATGQIDAMMDRIEQSQDRQNQAIRQMMDAVALQQQQAASTQLSAAQSFGAWVAQLQAQGLRVELVNVGGPGELA